MTGTCKICGRPLENRFMTLPERIYYLCRDCRTISLVPEPSKDDLRKYYNAMPANYKVALDQTASNSIKFSYFFRKYLKPVLPKGRSFESRILDVGCFSGDFLEHCRREGFDNIRGYEINETAKDVLRKKKIPVLGTDFISIDATGDNTFDVISMLDFIEHIADPLAYLAKARELLRKDETLVLTSPDANSIFARVLKGRWPVFDGMEHLHVFARRPLEDMLRKLGFRDVRSSALWKRTNIDYFLNIIAAWRAKSNPEKRTAMPARLFGKRSFKFYAGEFFIAAHK